MRTHRLKIECNCEDAAIFFESEILHVDFCDFTHWYCGLDNAGEDTPDDCVIYRGIMEPNVIYVDFNLPAMGNGEPESYIEQYEALKSNFKSNHNEEKWEVLKVECFELDSYKKVKELE